MTLSSLTSNWCRVTCVDIFLPPKEFVANRFTLTPQPWKQLVTEIGFAIGTYEVACLGVEAGVAVRAIGIPIRRPWRRPICDGSIVGRWRGNHIDWRRECTTYDGPNSETDEPRADAVSRLRRGSQRQCHKCNEPNIAHSSQPHLVHSLCESPC